MKLSCPDVKPIFMYGNIHVYVHVIMYVCFLTAYKKIDDYHLALVYTSGMNLGSRLSPTAVSSGPGFTYSSYILKTQECVLSSFSGFLLKQKLMCDL